MNVTSPSETCIRFESPLVVGTKYFPGDSFSEAGVNLTVAAFPRTSEKATEESCFALIKGRPLTYPLWTRNHVELFRVTLNFDFGARVSNVQSKYYDESKRDSTVKPDRVIEINTDSRPFSHVSGLDGESVGGVTISVDPDERNPGYGILTLDGLIDALTIGSVQQLCFEDVCFSRT